MHASKEFFNSTPPMQAMLSPRPILQMHQNIAQNLKYIYVHINVFMYIYLYTTKNNLHKALLLSRQEQHCRDVEKA